MKKGNSKHLLSLRDQKEQELREKYSKFCARKRRVNMFVVSDDGERIERLVQRDLARFDEEQEKINSKEESEKSEESSEELMFILEM